MHRPLKPGFTPEEECFPEALRFRVGSDGQLVPVRTEPVAGDAREGKDGKANAKLRLAAGLLDVSFDSLKQREQERRRRSLIAVASVAGVIAVLMTTLAGYAFFQRQEAEAQAQLAENRRLAAEGSERQANDARDQADGLINFMLHDLRDKLQPIGRLDVLDDVAKKAKEYLDKLPKELLNASRISQQAVLLRNLGDVLRDQGKLPEALDAYRKALAISDRWANQDLSNVSWQNCAARNRYCIAKVLIRIQDGDRDEAKRLITQGIKIMKGLEHQAASDTDIQDTLNKLKEIAIELGSSLGE
jgi:eukaryotic-like serine/threonine-protein kinase